MKKWQIIGHMRANQNKAPFLLSIICVVLLMTACAPVRQSSRLAQEENTKLVAGVGDPVISISQEKNLPNVFGASDIFGRTTPTGAVTVEYLGVRGDRAIFRRNSVAIETGATTMNSTPLIIDNSSTTTSSGMIGGAHYNGVSTTTGRPTVIPPNTPHPVITGQRSVEISVNLKKPKRQFIVEGKTVTIETADEMKVVYSIGN
ncbi:MAG: hypothetical protein WAO98_05370 [Alphaproteobacteria bacterium]